MTARPPNAPRTSRTVVTLVRAAGVWAVVGFLLTLCLLVSDGRLQRYQLLSVLSGSMVPTLDVGDLVVVRVVPADRLEAGELVTFLEPGTRKLMTHRVQSVLWNGQVADVVTRGDANQVGEDWSVAADDRVGEVVLRVPRLGYLVGTLATPVGRLAVVGLAVVVGLWTLVVLWRPEPAAQVRLPSPAPRAVPPSHLGGSA